tara:strand:+ start:155 stop:544 length:390 start_codon:yes stop_codon:yes gene_type:complete
MKERSFNNSMMITVAVPLVLMWICVAVYVIFMGINDESGRVQENLDYFTTLIGILGGPALLFISAILEAWKAEQQAIQNSMPERLELEIQKSLASHQHKIDMARQSQAHLHMLEDREQSHAHTSGAEEE